MFERPIGWSVWHAFALHGVGGMDHWIGLHLHCQRTPGPWSDPGGPSFGAALHHRTGPWHLANSCHVAADERRVGLEPSPVREECVRPSGSWQVKFER